MTLLYLGWALDRALAAIREAGQGEPVVVETRAPRGEPRGTPRVVRIQGHCLTVARFPDRVERA